MEKEKQPRPRPRPRRALSAALLISILLVAPAFERGGGACAWVPFPGVGTAVAAMEGEGPELASPLLCLHATGPAPGSGKVRVRGYAPGAEKVSLVINGTVTDSRLVWKDQFDFGRVSLVHGVSFIQVKAMDGPGNVSFSTARIVDRECAAGSRLANPSVLSLSRGPRDRPFLSLTLDAGSSCRRSEKILEVLKVKGIATTIFVTGRFIERYPEVVKKIVADGHEVGNHTFNHPHLTTYARNRRNTTAPGITRDRLQRELIGTREAFESLTGSSMSRWWRAPYGEHNEEILSWALEIGFTHVDWTRRPKNLDMLDWIANEHSRYYLDSDRLYRRLVGIDNGKPGGANGAIILMHLGSDRERDFTDAILPRAIDELRGRGYRFVTVSRMFGE